jgi:hypothetical protein
MVDGGTLYIFGADPTVPYGNAVYMIQSRDLVSWSAPVKLFTVPNNRIAANTSVTKDSTGYVMAVEECLVGSGCSVDEIYFYHSPDLLTWVEISGPMIANTYTAAPTIRYSGGYYYVFYMRSAGDYFFVSLTRSQNLQYWEVSNQVVVSPTESVEGVNTSDLDLVEYNGRVKIVYAIGYQTVASNHYMDIREAYYYGTLDEFLERFFSLLENRR